MSSRSDLDVDLLHTIYTSYTKSTQFGEAFMNIYVDLCEYARKSIIS